MSNVVTYDDLIEDQVAAIEDILKEDEVTYAMPCKGCLVNVPVPKVLVGTVDAVYCDDCSRTVFWEEMCK